MYAFVRNEPSGEYDVLGLVRGKDDKTDALWWLFGEHEKADETVLAEKLRKGEIKIEEVEEEYRKLQKAIEKQERLGITSSSGPAKLLQRKSKLGAFIVRHGGKLTGLSIAYLFLKGSTAMAASSREYAVHNNRGDVAMADLAAIDIAIQMMDVTGDYFMAYVVLDILLQ